MRIVMMACLTVGLIAGATGCGVDRPATGSGGRGDSATGGDGGGVGAGGGAGGLDINSGCNGIAGAGPGGAMGGAGDGVHPEGSLELLAGDLGDPSFPALTDPPVGAGLEIRLPVARGMAVAGTGLYVAVHGPSRSLVDFNKQPYVLDLVTGQVGPVPISSGELVTAGAFASDGDGTLYFASSACAIYRLVPPARCPELLWPGPPTCLDTYMDTPIVSNIGFAFSGGHLYLSDSYKRGILDLDPETHVGSPVPDTDSLRVFALAAGSDGMLYVSAYNYADDPTNQRIFRVDPILGGAEFFTDGTRPVAADQRGHLFVGGVSSVDRVDLATGDRVVVAGVPSDPTQPPKPGAAEVVLGPLPGKVGLVRGLATTASGDLVIASGNDHENVLLLAHFSAGLP